MPYLLQFIDRASYGQTNLHPIGLAAILCLVAATFTLRRSRALIPFLLVLTMISAGQRLVIGGMDFTFLRIATIALWARVLMRNEHRGLKFSTLDYAVMAFGAMSLLANILLFGEFSKVIMQVAKLLESVGGYFVFRALIRTPDDLRALSKSLAWIAIGSSGLFVAEQFTRHNVFAVFGGVLERTAMREGRVRCQGAFVHPLMAGCFWAAATPLVAAPFFQRGSSRMLHAIGVFACGAIVATTASSTPVLSYMTGFGCACWYPLRTFIPAVRWGSFALMCVLHAVMKAPIWHLISRMSLVGGSTGYHRFFLIDNFIKHWYEWFLYGTISTRHWGHLMWDLTNQFVLVGVRGGIVYLLLFLLILWLCFNSVGVIVRRKQSVALTAWAWAGGSSLAVHCMSFMGVSYFGTAIPMLYITFAVIATLRDISDAQRKRSKQTEAARLLKHRRSARTSMVAAPA